jgi:hypothetical protein
MSLRGLIKKTINIWRIIVTQLPRGNQNQNMKDVNLLIKDSVKSALTIQKASAIYHKISLTIYLLLMRNAVVSTSV